MTKPIRIITDSAVDMPLEERKELGIHVAPLSIMFPAGEVSSEDLTPDEFYEQLRLMEPEIPTTSMPSPGYFAALFNDIIQQGEDPVAIHISSGLSGTIEASRQGARQADLDVTIVDSMTLSGGQRFQVLAAARAAQRGFTKEEMLERLAKIRESTEVVYTLETLTYLQHGGRIGRVSGLLASILDIKPVIKVDQADGKYTTAAKARSIRRAVDALVDYLEERFGAETPLWISVLHGQLIEQAEQLASQLKKSLTIERSEILRISPVLGVHTGPGIVGVAALPIALMQDLI